MVFKSPYIVNIILNKEPSMDGTMKIISDLTRTDDVKRRRLFRWFAKEPPLTQLEAVDLMVKNYHQLKTQHPQLNQKELYYLGFIKALANMTAVEKAPTHKAADHNLEPLRKITKIQAERVRALKKKKQSPKRKKLVSLWGLVKQLRHDEGLSFRDIAAFLEKHRNFKVNYAYIQRVWKELEG
jgi:hypothetical protein